MRKPQGGTPYNGIYTEALREKNDKKTSCFNDLFRSLLKKVYERGAFSNKRYTKGVPFLKKMEYKRVRGWTLGRSLPI